MLLWPDRRWVTYKGKNKMRTTYDLNDIMALPDLSKRIKVCHLLVANKSAPLPHSP